MKNIAVITGASSGLGIKFLEAVIQRYPYLDEYWILARRKERLDALKEKYEAVKIVPVEADLSDATLYVNLSRRLAEEKPSVKVLINNAGYEKSGQFITMEEKDICSMVSVNVQGMTMIERTFIPYMAKGSFTVITCSISSFAPVPNQSVYSATKKYVYFFGKALREELKERGSNVLLLCPGNMDTEMNPKGEGRQSNKINKLPFLDMEKLTRKSLIRAERGKGVYTPGVFYKFYRLAAKMLPSLWMAKTAKKFY